MVAPKQESSDLVMQWLTSDVSSPEAKITTKGDYVTIHASVKTIEKLLNAEYSIFGMSNFWCQCPFSRSDENSTPWDQREDPQNS
jgi:hypothetical protein